MQHKYKIAIFLFALLAAAGIIAFRTLPANSAKNNASYGTMSIYLNRGIFLNAPINFTFGKTTFEAVLFSGEAIQAEPNLGEYVESLDKLNVIAANNDVVIVFIPGPGNVPIDEKTKAAIHEIQRDFKRGNTTTGLYTLWHDSYEYSEISKQTKTPAIVVARNGKGTVTMSGSNVNTYMLFQAYLKASAEDCCEFITPNCCN